MSSVRVAKNAIILLCLVVFHLTCKVSVNWSFFCDVSLYMEMLVQFSTYLYQYFHLCPVV